MHDNDEPVSVYYPYEPQMFTSTGNSVSSEKRWVKDLLIEKTSTLR